MNIKNIKISDLILYENNPRKNEEAVDKVAASIREFGFKVPMVIDKNNVIVCGHTRYKACLKLGITEVPAVIADDLTDDQIKAFRIADNKTAEFAEWDLEKMAKELESIDMDMLQFGIEKEEIQKEVDAILDAEQEAQDDFFDVDDAIEAIQEPKSKRGDIYILGRHKLMCGDSTSPEDVRKLIGESKMDLCVTDPPYNVDIGITDIKEAKIRKRRTDGKTIQNDKMSDAEFNEFLNKAFANMAEALKPGGVFYIWLASSTMKEFIDALTTNNLKVRQHLIWVKNSLILGRQDYQWIHEPCLYGWKDGAGHYFIEDRTQTTVIQDPADIDAMSKTEMRDLLKYMFSEEFNSTVIHCDKPSRSAEHPTMKPIKLLSRQIKNSSRINEKVIDLFGGSGSTLITYEQLKRDCYMMEYDPKYVDVIIQRWETMTGEKAVKLSG